jgi:hypothetical protein
MYFLNAASHCAPNAPSTTCTPQQQTQSQQQAFLAAQQDRQEADVHQR